MPRSRRRRSGTRLVSPLAGGGGQAQETPCLGEDVVEGKKAAAQADDIEKVAVLAGRGVAPFTGRALADAVLSAGPTSNVQACCALADEPVAALAATVRR